MSGPDLGIYDAMNKGIKISSGDVIGILNSDDFYENNAIFDIENAIFNYPHGDIYYGYLRLLFKDGREFNIYRYNYENYLADLNCNYQAAAQHPSCFICKKLYDKLGLYDISYKTAADYDFLIRAKLNGAKFIAIDSIITNFLSGGATFQVNEIDSFEQKNRTHFANGLITRKQFINSRKYMRLVKLAKIKEKFFQMLSKIIYFVK
jgi:glycosyltransferase involved in cell wall biosynthesis